MMKNPRLSVLLSFRILLFFSTIKIPVLVNSQCIDDQRTSLWELKNNLNCDSEQSTRLVQWNLEVDCCSWKGVGCDASGRVIALELVQEFISGGEDNLTSLFRLQYLEKLNLALNYFIGPIPKGIANLTNLVYLNMSNSGFTGQIPVELSSLRTLVILDLSTYFPGERLMKLENPSMKTILQNLSDIEEIYLDSVDLSAQRRKWSQAIATSLPKLRVLSLRKCYISGPIHVSLSSLHNLSVVRLDHNNISAEVPEFFANMPNLRTLSLIYCNLVGQFPVKIFQVRALETLDISLNTFLQGSLPPFNKKSSLRNMVISYTRFSGPLPYSIGNLQKLSRIDLSSCNFSGTIPTGLQYLSELSFIDLSYNNFSGSVPKFQACKNLVYLDLSHNSLTGSLFSDHFQGLQSLSTLSLENNSLSGSFPLSIFKLPALRELGLGNNQFSGQIDEIPVRLSISQTQLHSLDLSYNQFNGSFPKFIFELKKLNVLSLASNSFSDNIQLEAFKNINNLTTLDLSFNNLIIEPQSYNSSLEYLSVLNLASCKLQSFPEMRDQTRLRYLDLSGNELTGEVPNWIWNLSLTHVNLSLNLLEGFQKPYEFPDSLLVIDLHSNQLQGEVPIPSTIPVYVDFSVNKFSGPIPSITRLYFQSTIFLSISNNGLTGTIPDAICMAAELLVLDLSYNSLNGTIPPCLVTSGYLGVLNLARNNLSGSITDTFPTNCSLKTIDLGMNLLQGKLPRSLSNCAQLEVLNLGNNKIEDSFPCMFENSSNLHVLNIRSNKFHGELECFGYNYSWPRLQIIDIASNNFSGVLSSEFFTSLKGMSTLYFAQEPQRGNYLRFRFLDLNNFYYQFKVTVTMKGNERELEKILTIFTSINFSNNKFSGEIPESIGDLRLLYNLDLSHNAFTGGIPSSIGELHNLGSLDLSMNQLKGEIPSALKDLTFLSSFNISFNVLTGHIPIGPQFQTFSNDSYMGNLGLCGFPLSVSCGNANVNGPSSSVSSLSNKNEIEWMYISASMGYAVGLGMFLMLLMLCGRLRGMFFHHVDHLLLKMLNKKRDIRITPVLMEQIRRL